MASLLERPASPKTMSLVSVLALLAFLPLLLLATYQSVILITRAAAVPANIVVDAKAILEPIRTDFYHAFAQGGEEAKDMIAPVAGRTRDLRPKYIRIDHIYDYYNVVSRSGDGLSFDWSRLDQVIGTIRSTGALPVIALSYMPQAIARDGVVINPPNNWDEWATTVQRTIEHYSGKGGQNIGGIYYEVWNEPDLPQFGSWKIGGDKNYLTLYQYAAKGAGAAQNTNWFYFGGPATTGLYKNWILGLAGSGYRVDFFSWHSYLTDPKRFDQDQRNVIDWLLPYPWHTTKPMLITEFGFTGGKSKGYAGTYGAAHTAAVIRQLISGGPSWLFSFEIVDGPAQANDDGWGLMRHPDRGASIKPRYLVYSFIDQMAGNRLQLQGEGTRVTAFATTKDQVIRIFLVNFDSYGGNNPEDVPIRIINLDPTTYTLDVLYRFGSDTQKPVSLSPTDGAITTKVHMPAQSIAIVELKKQ